MIFFVLEFLILLFSFNLPIIEMNSEETTVETIIVETTTQYVPIITDIPQSDIELAMNHDYGRYTTMAFNYINSQYDNLQNNENCFDEYTKCLITQSISTPVCAVNHPNYPRNRPRGFKTFNSYCDAYFDNCLKTIRYWRILDTGICNFSIPDRLFDITPFRKYLGYQPQRYILKQLYD
ncbi:uncharacterized protein LOC126778299 [Nymphalis io]|uniref:uncharacterized protein LOC126778299 n=1 Tax=Inachis io TaxID=171585 RepID=UPI00216813A5|nr:uncharacterized protein LOC126778299 [Nymphalis io]